MVQRDLALEPAVAVVEPPQLTADEVEDAIAFNNRRYQEDEIRLIQDVVGAEVTGEMNEETVRLIALMQQEFGLGADGKVGDETFSLLERELIAEALPDDQCLVSFRAPNWVWPLRFDAAGVGHGAPSVSARFDMDARFDRRCNCADFEYRQFICGDVARIRGGVRTNLNGVFTGIPGGRMPACLGFVEDGDTNLPPGTGPNYGHRNQGGDANDRYTPTRRRGCEYHGFDVLGLHGIPNVTGDQYDFDVRFRGEIHRRRGGRFRRVNRRTWAVRGLVTVP